MIDVYTNFKIQGKDNFGNTVYEDTARNLVLSTGLDLIRDHLVSTQLALALYPYKFMLGTGTTAVMSTDTGLQTSEYDKTITDVDLRAPGGVTYNSILYSSESNGVTLTEVGMFTSSSGIIARLLISPIVKSSVPVINYYLAWDFDFTAST